MATLDLFTEIPSKHRILKLSQLSKVLNEEIVSLSNGYYTGSHYTALKAIRVFDENISVGDVFLAADFIFVGTYQPKIRIYFACKYSEDYNLAKLMLSSL